MRKPHIKSRFGCKQCKTRKVKCDETKPACCKCVTRKEHCSYLDQRHVLPTPTSTPGFSSIASGSPHHSQDYSTSTSGFSGIASGSPHHSQEYSTSNDVVTSSPHTDNASRHSPSPSFFVEKYSLLHLELLDHFKNRQLCFGQPSWDQILQIALKEAYQTPYLMDELLAFAAAHKSTLVSGDMQHLYRTESIRLQTRAVAQVDFSQTSSAENSSLASFIFSAILGQHVLFDVFSSALDFAKSLDKLIHCFNLHHGIRSTAGESWKTIHAVVYTGDPGNRGFSETLLPATTEGSHCDTLLDHLNRGGLDKTALDIYKQTVKILQYLLDSVHSSHSRRIIALQEWPVRISLEYISLLQQRRPEALVILAYYGVLLHYARDYWAVGNSGRLLISSISSHLGDYWADWLVWPKQNIEES